MKTLSLTENLDLPLAYGPIEARQCFKIQARIEPEPDPKRPSPIDDSDVNLQHHTFYLLIRKMVDNCNINDNVYHEWKNNLVAITFPQKNGDNTAVKRLNAASGSSSLHNLSTFPAVLPGVTGVSQCTSTKTSDTFPPFM